ncbi:MAG TPA: CocE/NonD family hydrolase, partial [Candidatus Thermoplasmatota archaeon]|nr:CocE/NonD family hydrolase [Candidatus Thermoplasmatota archaeon]
MARTALPLAVLALLGSVALPGCIRAMDEYYGFDPVPQYKNPGVFEGTYRMGSPSAVLQPGPYKPSPPEVVRLVSDLPAYPGPLGATTDAHVFIPMAIWRPQDATEPVPIIVDAGPYYEVFEHCAVPGQNPCQEWVPDTIDHPNQMTPFLLENILPHGYAVVQLAVRGTGTHGGCMDLLGPSEQHDLVQALNWLGEQPWSNGNIGMIGVSYDGSTPWVAAASPENRHVKTIVPISGLPDIYDLMFRNGSAESRGLIMHSTVYWGYGFSEGWPYNRLPVPFPAWPSELPAQPPTGMPPWPGSPAPRPIANGRDGYQDMQN